MSGNNGDERQDISGRGGVDKRGDISVDDGRRGFRSQDSSHSSSNNRGGNVDGDWRVGYMLRILILERGLTLINGQSLPSK